MPIATVRITEGFLRSFLASGETVRTGWRVSGRLSSEARLLKARVMPEVGFLELEFEDPTLETDADVVPTHEVFTGDEVA